MQFTLYYRGSLKSGNSAKALHKHEVRQHFHCQLKNLWEESPLSSFHHFLEQPGEGNLSLLEQKGLFTFVPLISERNFSVAELDLSILWPQPPGAILSSSGDIDNRLKTLLDALKYPSETNALPEGIVPTEDEKPFFCLLQDDSLITRLSVETDRLLEPVTDPSEVILSIRVKVRLLKRVAGNMGLP